MTSNRNERNLQRLTETLQRLRLAEDKVKKVLRDLENTQPEIILQEQPNVVVLRVPFILVTEYCNEEIQEDPACCCTQRRELVSQHIY